MPSPQRGRGRWEATTQVYRAFRVLSRRYTVDGTWACTCERRRMSVVLRRSVFRAQVGDGRGRRGRQRALMPHAVLVARLARCTTRAAIRHMVSAQRTACASTRAHGPNARRTYARMRTAVFDQRYISRLILFFNT